jgi:DNA-binding transcriptional MerR regulator
MEQTQPYTVRQLAHLAGVSVRTLHHYDQLGLLSPTERTPAGYRLYHHSDLLRLQQILFYKELDVPLDEIRRLLDQPGFDPLNALQDHRRKLSQRIQRLERLLHTVDQTIRTLKEDNMTLSDEDLYTGFTQEQRERYDREVKEMYNPALVAESKRRLRKLTKDQWQAVKQAGQAAVLKLADLIDQPVESPKVQAAVADHHAWIENFYTANAEVYRGLGRGYVEDPEFRQFHEQVKPGLADFMCAAMAYYADHTLQQQKLTSPHRLISEMRW